MSKWRTGRPAALLLAHVFSAGIVGITPARAQLLDAWSLDSGILLDRALPSARLQALGGMREAVADENNEINLLDFGGNLAGHLDDKPGSHVDGFTGPRAWFDRTRPSTRDQQYRVFPTGVRINALPGSHYAVGGSIEDTRGSGSRLIGGDLRRRFHLPVEGPADGSADGLLLESELSASALSAYYVRRLGRVAAGLEGGYTKEEEERSTPSLYEIDHDATIWSARGSLAAQVIEARGPVRNVVVGASGRLATADIEGLSADQVHRDVFAWDRPSVGFQVQLLGRIGETMKGGLDFRYDSFEGQETVSMNWSPQFRLNPTENTIRIERSTFEEGFRSSAFRARWALEPAGRSLAWGAGFHARQQEYWQIAAPNVNSFVTSKVERLTDWRGTGGGSYYLPRGRGLVAAELAYGWADRDNRVSAPAVRVGASGFEIGGGAELAVALNAVARGGYRLLLDDGNRDRESPESELTTHRLAFGAGYRSETARLMLDLGFAYDFVDPDAGGGAGAGANAVEGQDRRALTIQVRSVF